MSRYSKLLARIIAESECTAKEIVKRCNEMGNGIDETRLSKLQSGKLSAPSDKVSRDISRACGIDERPLVIEGYLEKAPQEIIEAFKILKDNSILAGTKVFEGSLPKEQMEKIKEIFYDLPLSDIVIDLLDSKSDELEIENDMININSDDLKISLQEPTSILVEDNAMFPMIPEKSKVKLKLQEKYENGNIVAVKREKEDKINIRYILFEGNNVILTPLNSKYKKMIYKKEEIAIIGKVTKVIIDI